MVSNLRVQLVHKPVSPRTGIGRYATELERGLREAGVDLHMASLATPVPAFLKMLTQRAGYDLHTFFQSYPICADVRPGYLTHLTSQTLATLLITRRVPRPVVVTVHDILPYLLRDDPELNVYRNRAQRWMDALAMRGLRRADMLIADSEYTKTTLIDVLGIPKERTIVIHLGVDTDHFRPLDVPPEFMEKYRLSADRRYLLFVGSDEPRKNLPVLLQALARVRDEHPDIALIKVGAPGAAEWRAKHLRLCRELGITRDVYWFDDVPDGDLPLFYNLARFFVFASLLEGFGLPVLEAQACGTPVISVGFDPTGVLIDEAAAAVKCGHFDALVKTLDNSLHLVGTGSRARVQTCQEFSWERTVSRTIHVYEQLAREEEGEA